MVTVMHYLITHQTKDEAALLIGGRMKAMTEHTPGPWKVGKIYSKGQESSIAVHPCHFYFTGTIENINRADAQLIAAAPELLKALKLIASGERTDGTQYDKYDARGFIRIAKEAITNL